MTIRKQNDGMTLRTRMLHAVLTVLLVGLVMPDAPRVQRHAKTQAQTLIEEQAAAAASKRQTTTRPRTAKEQAAPPDPSKIIRDPSEKKKYNPANRSARTVLPKSKLR